MNINEGETQYETKTRFGLQGRQPGPSRENLKREKGAGKCPLMIGKRPLITRKSPLMVGRRDGR